MSVDLLRAILRDAEGKTYSFAFVDGTDMLAQVVSATHVDENDTIILIRAGALPGECAWNVRLADIRSVSSLPGE